MGVLFDLHGTKRYNIRKVSILLGVLVLLTYAVLLSVRAPLRAVWDEDMGSVLVIDPGHGGIDGGAIAADGTRESGINLAIALRMQALAELFGQRYIMTRTKDVTLSDMQKYSEHEDLAERARIASDTPGAVLVSIHQNCYIAPQPHGAQTLYADDEESRRLGTMIHDSLNKYLDPENRRLAEPAPKKLFLTSNADCPAVLVECGFMSNPNDLSKLKSSGYQTALAAVMLTAFLKYDSDHST